MLAAFEDLNDVSDISAFAPRQTGLEIELLQAIARALIGPGRIFLINWAVVQIRKGGYTDREGSTT